MIISHGRDVAGRLNKLLKVIWIPVLLGIAGLLPFYSQKAFVGDKGDARFNMYVMEHGYRSMKHHHSNPFWNAPFFYPHKNVIAYSEHLWGNLPIYAAFRAAKCTREAAFEYWLLVSLGLTYVSGYWALRNFGAGRLAAGLAAYVFAYGLPVVQQYGHAQLLPRYLVPLVFVAASRWASSGKIRDFAWVALLLVGQMYLGIYTGILTGVILAAYLAALLLLGERKEVFFNFTGASMKAFAARAAILVIVGIALLPIAIPYHEAAKEVGMRTWRDVATMLPRLNSWLFPASHSLMWSWLSDISFLGCQNLPMRDEHRLFPGLAVVASLLAWPFVRLSSCRLNFFANQGWWAVVFCFVLTLFAWGWTFWSLAFYVPGVGALRAVTRIALYMLFPMSMVLAAMLDALIEWVKPFLSRPGGVEARQWGAGFLLSMAVLVDSGVSSVYKTTFRDALSGVKKIKAHLKAQGKPAVFWVCQGTEDADYVTQLDAMLAAQDLNIPTINGYSGWNPPGYDLALFKPNAVPPFEFRNLRAWLKQEGVSDAVRRKLIVLDKNERVDWAKPGKKYVLGTVLPFTPGHCESYLEQGFSGVEPEGIWTNKSVASLVLPVDALPGRDLSLTLESVTSPLAPGMHNAYRVKINGTEIGSRRADAPEPFTWTLAIPREVAASRNGEMAIEILSEEIISIKKCHPKSKDKRSVGLFLKSLRID